MHIDENKKLDKRSIDQKIREGLVSEREYEDHLASLSDVSHKVDDGQDTPQEKEEKKKEK